MTTNYTDLSRAVMHRRDRIRVGGSLILTLAEMSVFDGGVGEPRRSVWAYVPPFFDEHARLYGVPCISVYGMARRNMWYMWYALSRVSSRFVPHNDHDLLLSACRSLILFRNSR